MSGEADGQRRGERAAALAASKPEPKEFNAVVASAKVQSIRLAGTSFKVKPAALTTSRAAWKFKVADELRDWDCDNEARTLRGEMGFTAICSHRGSRIIVVEARYVATFKTNRECEDQAAGHFLTRVGRFMCYPYFRAVFATLTEQSGLLLPPLPIIEEQPRLVRGPGTKEEG